MTVDFWDTDEQWYGEPDYPDAGWFKEGTMAHTFGNFAGAVGRIGGVWSQQFGKTAAQGSLHATGRAVDLNANHIHLNVS